MKDLSDKALNKLKENEKEKYSVLVVLYKIFLKELLKSFYLCVYYKAYIYIYIYNIFRMQC